MKMTLSFWTNLKSSVEIMGKSHPILSVYWVQIILLPILFLYSMETTNSLYREMPKKCVRDSLLKSSQQSQKFFVEMLRLSLVVFRFKIMLLHMLIFLHSVWISYFHTTLREKSAQIYEEFKECHDLQIVVPSILNIFQIPTQSF